MAHANRNNIRSQVAMKYSLLLLITGALLFSPASYATVDEAQENIALLIQFIDIKHQSFSTKFQDFLFKNPQKPALKHKEIKMISSSVKNLIHTENSILAANIIYSNITVLSENYENTEIFGLIQVLLNQNDIKTANRIFDLIKREGDRSLISNMAFRFAIYYFSRNDWEKALSLLNEATNDLPDEDYYHALLMQGISLQNINKHRESISFYKKIKSNSKYFISAKLNMAIANIRQGWWTDGHSIIRNMINSPKLLIEEEALNRLYLTLGYSLMKQSYFRNAADSFRSIGIDSTLVTRALLGISLSEAQQKDFISALNSARILNKKVMKDLPVDESYLLIPYFYEKLQQSGTASSGYLEAINYYQKRISSIESIINSEISPEGYPFVTNTKATLEINDNLLIIPNGFPSYFFENYIKLKVYKGHLEKSKVKNIHREYDLLVSMYRTTSVKIIRKLLKQRVKQLSSYMNQSRLGLARLYDNN